MRNGEEQEGAAGSREEEQGRAERDREAKEVASNEGERGGVDAYAGTYYSDFRPIFLPSRGSERR